MGLEGKVAIVTGASRGIGLEIAKHLAQAGARVACIATTQLNADNAVTLIGNGLSQGFACDVSDWQAVEGVFDRISDELGAPSILINNAGIARDALLMRMKDDDWDRVIGVNLKGAYLCTKAVIRPMIKARYGRIVNMASIIGLSGAAGQANYAASKAGLLGLTKSTAKELGSRGITCNAVAPGFIETDMTEELPKEMKGMVAKNAPAGRLGTPADVAHVVLFLVSEAAGYMTGQTLVVDGGLSL